MDCMIMYYVYVFHRRNKAQRSDLAHGSGFFNYFGLWIALIDMSLFCKTIDLISITIVSGIEYPAEHSIAYSLVTFPTFSNLRDGQTSTRQSLHRKRPHKARRHWLAR